LIVFVAKVSSSKLFFGCFFFGEEKEEKNQSKSYTVKLDVDEASHPLPQLPRKIHDNRRRKKYPFEVKQTNNQTNKETNM
jgi:hypothetical protein